MMIFLMIKEPYKIDMVDSNGNLVPEVELFNAQNYQLKEGEVESIGVGYSLYRSPFCKPLIHTRRKANKQM